MPSLVAQPERDRSKKRQTMRGFMLATRVGVAWLTRRRRQSNCLCMSEAIQMFQVLMN
jgi:hypothetical protein